MSSIPTSVARTNTVSQIDGGTLQTLAGLDAHSAVMAATDSDAVAGAAPREAFNAAQVAAYGTGLNLDAANRATKASLDSQSAIQANLDNAFRATSSAAGSAYAASFPSSHQWTD